MSEIKPCIDCKYYQRNHCQLCTHPDLKIFDPVNGDYHNSFCVTNRNSKQPNQCGMDGRFFEQKQRKPFIFF